MATFVCVTIEGEGRGKKLAAWMRTVLVHEETKEIFAPAVMGSNGERMAWLCCSFDGVGMINYRKHAFVPLSRLEKEYPDRRDVWARIRENVDKFAFVDN